MAKCLNCLKGCKAAIEGIENAWQCENFKIGIYKNLPEGMRLAVKDDIFPIGKFNIGIHYLLYSRRSGVYQVYKTSVNTDIWMLSQFIADERCWVKM